MKRSFEHRVSKSGWVTVPFFRVGFVEARLGPIVAACTPNRRFYGNTPSKASKGARKAVFS